MRRELESPQNWWHSGVPPCYRKTTRVREVWRAAGTRATAVVSAWEGSPLGQRAARRQQYQSAEGEQHATIDKHDTRFRVSWGVTSARTDGYGIFYTTRRSATALTLECRNQRERGLECAGGPDFHPRRPGPSHKVQYKLRVC